MSTRELLLVASMFAFGCGGTVTEGTGGSGTGGAGGGPSSTSSSVACSCDAYFPVCGVDGQTYNAGCGDDCVPVEIDCRDECPCVSCDELQMDYYLALSDAKDCNPLIDFNECTQMVPDELDCPCSTYVNPANQEAIEKLAAIRELYEVEGCSVAACPAVECEPPTAGACVALGGGSGSCQDQFAPPGGG